MEFYEGVFVAYWVSRDQVVILHRRTLGSVVEFDFGVRYMQCELGPASDFEILVPYE